MPKLLTEPQIARFRDDGFLFPVNICSAEEAAAMHGKIQEMEETLGEEPQEGFSVKAQLPFPWLCDLVSHPKLLDAVEDLIGPDIMCWGASYFAKKPHDPRYVSWHTDSFFYGYELKETIAAWFFSMTPRLNRAVSATFPAATRSRRFMISNQVLKILSRPARQSEASMKARRWMRYCASVRWFFTTKAWCMARGRTGRIIRGWVFRSIIARPMCAKPAMTARRSWCCADRTRTVSGGPTSNRNRIMTQTASSGCWTRARNSSTLQTKK